MPRLSFVICAAILVVPFAAHAAPAPADLPELVPHTEVDASVGVGSVLLANTAVAELGGRFAVGNHVELFANLPARAQGFVDIGGGNRRTSATTLGSLRAGTRYMHRLRDAGAIGIAGWVWVPTGVGTPLDDGLLWSQLDGLGDARAFLSEPAAALALDAARWWPDVYAQLQVGTAIVRDRGPQVDNVFVTFAVGKQVSTKTSIHGGYRVEAFPGGMLHMPSFSIGRGDATQQLVRFSFHPTIASRDLPFALAFTIDLVQR